MSSEVNLGQRLVHTTLPVSLNLCDYGIPVNVLRRILVWAFLLQSFSVIPFGSVCLLLCVSS